MSLARHSTEQQRELLELAKRAASQAAVVHRREMVRQRFAVDTKRSANDLVTEVDRESERELVKTIRAARPDDGIVGEEGTNIIGTSGVCWILDPLDGTTNFVHQYPAHSVAVGVEIDGRRVIGVVHDTSSDRVYSGIAGEGATCDDKLITVRNEDRLEQALVGTGFLPDPGVRRLQADLLGRVLPRVRDVRRSGCPSLDICGVASGVLDAYYECGLGQWDISAAAAIAEAAGATVSVLDSDVLPHPFVVVANPELASPIVSLLVETGMVNPPNGSHPTFEASKCEPVKAARQIQMIERLIPPVSESDLPALAQLLVDAVDSGAAVSFLAPLTTERAEAWWRETISLADARAIFLVARDAGGIVGSVQLHPAWAPNQPHRADIAKLLVHRRGRGQGLGTQLMKTIEEEARRAGFTLLTLDAKHGAAAEHLYRKIGWNVVGTIPRYALDHDGTPHDTVIFYKELDQLK